MYILPRPSIPNFVHIVGIFVGITVNMSLERDFIPRKSLGIRPPSPLCVVSVRFPYSECVVQMMSQTCAFHWVRRYMKRTYSAIFVSVACTREIIWNVTYRRSTLRPPYSTQYVLASGFVCMYSIYNRSNAALRVTHINFFIRTREKKTVSSTQLWYARRAQ